MLLTETERLRFIEWLTANIHSNKQLLPQMTGPAFAPVLQKFKAETMAMEIVLSILVKTQVATIGPSETGELPNGD